MKKAIIISGISGAGKTTATNAIEDMGYKCIDQYPVELLDDLIKLIKESDKYETIAMSVSLMDLAKFRLSFKEASIPTTLILIDAEKDEIIKRYKFSRRVHPLLVSNTVSTLSEAVDYEKNELEKYKDDLVNIIDTTNLPTKKCKAQLDKILKYEEVNNLTITFESFGYKYGLPDDADQIIDVRFLDNPYWEESLKKKTGKHKAVKEYVLNSDKTQEYLKTLTSMFDLVLKSYKQEEKRHLNICIGCTGGQHRSVVITEYLFNYYKDKYVCSLKHRELK